jgi:uncharacterized protein YwqG
MVPDEFRERLLEYQRPAREMILTSGDPGCKPISKISGVPWWPSDLGRPVCGRGHRMSFMAQFRLSDVPSFEQQQDILVSFHYCQECAYEGMMSFGWNCPFNKPGYEISIITGISSRRPDLLGTVAEVVIDPQTVRFREVIEAPGYEDTLLLLPDVPEDYPQGRSDLDESIYPDVIHVANRKLGGWPTWVQYPDPPKVADQERLTFLAQLDWLLCDRATWGGGGYAYLFLIGTCDEVLRGELAIQTT